MSSSPQVPLASSADEIKIIPVEGAEPPKRDPDAEFFERLQNQVQSDMKEGGKDKTEAFVERLQAEVARELSNSPKTSQPPTIPSKDTKSEMDQISEMIEQQTSVISKVNFVYLFHLSIPFFRVSLLLIDDYVLLSQFSCIVERIRRENEEIRGGERKAAEPRRRPRQDRRGARGRQSQAQGPF